MNSYVGTAQDPLCAPRLLELWRAGTATTLTSLSQSWSRTLPSPAAVVGMEGVGILGGESCRNSDHVESELSRSHPGSRNGGVA